MTSLIDITVSVCGPAFWLHHASLFEVSSLSVCVLFVLCISVVFELDKMSNFGVMIARDLLVSRSTSSDFLLY